MFKIVVESTGKVLIDRNTNKPVFVHISSEQQAKRAAASLSAVVGVWLKAVRVS